MPGWWCPQEQSLLERCSWTNVAYRGCGPNPLLLVQLACPSEGLMATTAVDVLLSDSVGEEVMALVQDLHSMVSVSQLAMRYKGGS